ncbi:tape measure protein [Acinetobacter pseudolwoffii]|uniref:tape measure protein n=1 Tax=Acinetobacter pseudolwoffii TaxID=2053287 RepID=UPI00209B0799|nr:tape measure protein [Acinetobacter pseudolwoffii]MCO8092078.1 tape measure protein [Acinetobacter pseudolwoffii]
MSGKNLTFKLVMDADTKTFVSNMHQSEKAAKEAFAALKDGSANLVGDTNSATKEVDQLGTQSQETAQQIKQLDKELEVASQELQQTEQASKGVSGELQGLKTGFNALTGALAALGIGTTAMEIAQTADEYKNLSGRLSIAIGEHGNLQKAMDDVKNVAIATNSNLTATGDLYSRLTKIGQEMKWPQEQALALTETINKAIQVGGGSAQANEAAITQLNQALGSGVLRGDEFNSMMEQSPRLAQALADGLDVTTGKLREMAGEGELTTDVVTKALLSQSEAISAEFSKFPTTIGASIENLKTAWTVYIGEADAATGASSKVAEAIKFVAENLDTIVSTLTLAGQAFIAYKALNIGMMFLDKAAGIRAASTAIAQETTAVVANTQAQIANATATRTAVAAKTQLAAGSTAAATSAAATGGSIMTLVSRLGALGVAVTAFGVLVPTVFQPIGTAIGEGAAKLMGYGKAIEDLEKQMALEEARTKVAAEVKASFTAAAEKARDKTYQLTEESKKLITEFDELIKKGEPTKEALEKISNAMKFDSTKGINDSITALIALKDQGKITADELQVSLGKALDGKDLLVFETNARAAFAGTSKEAEKNAQITEAVMKAALERTGLSTEQLQGKFSLAFQSATNDVQIILNNLDQYKQKGIDTGLALASNLNKAIDTAQTRAELDYAKSSLIALEKQGLITGNQVALSLSKIEEKARQLPAALNPVEAAFAALGIKTKEQLGDAAESAKRNFDVVSKSGQATAKGIKQAYTEMLDAAIASGDKAKIAAVQAKAASHGLTVEIGDTGKAVVQTTSEWVKANVGVDNSVKAIKNSYREVGRVAREEAKSSTEAWADAVTKAKGEFDKAMKQQSKSLGSLDNYDSYNKNDVISMLKSQGYDDKDAKKLAGNIWSQAMEADRDAKMASYGNSGVGGMDTLMRQMYDDAAKKGITTQHGTNKINELMRSINVASTGSNLNDYAPSIPSVPSTKDYGKGGDSVNYNIQFGGQTLSLTGDASQKDVMTSLVNQLKGIAKST